MRRVKVVEGGSYRWKGNTCYLALYVDRGDFRVRYRGFV